MAASSETLDAGSEGEQADIAREVARKLVSNFFIIIAFSTYEIIAAILHYLSFFNHSKLSTDLVASTDLLIDFFPSFATSTVYLCMQ